MLSVLPWFYMNGDWMEYEPQADELSQSGPLLSSYHYILDVSLLGEFAAILDNQTLADKYPELLTPASGLHRDCIRRGQRPAVIAVRVCL